MSMSLRRSLFRWRITRSIFVLFALFNFLEVFRIHHNLSRSTHAQVRSTMRPRSHERIYIASIHFNNGPILNAHWNDALLDLTQTFGSNNVFVSIFESGSWDDTKQALSELGRKLEEQGVPHHIEVSDRTHQEELDNPIKTDGWINTPRNKRELRRIPFLARLRNMSIKHLRALYSQGIKFDKVLFLNDVVFTTADVLALLNTNRGVYAAACSLDFAKPPLFYDTFALRDRNGDSHIMQTWPYFRSKNSRNALTGNLDAVPVSSCWNGIVAMRAEPFTSSTNLEFRGIPDSLAQRHLEGSECCLIHADNPLSKQLGVYLNPRVRVGYSLEAYSAVNPSNSGSWVSAWHILTGLWINRIKRWTVLAIDRMVVRLRVKSWKRQRTGNHEPGEFCLINEMQVIVRNGWAHV